MSYRERLMRPEPADNPEWVEQAYRSLFGSPEGRLVLDHICTVICGVDSRLFHPEQSGLGYNLARRDVGLDIWHLATGHHELSKPEVKTHE